MADISQVEEALVKSIAGILFGSTNTYQNYSVATTTQMQTNTPVRLMRGWVIDNQLVTDLKAGITSISVFGDPAVATMGARIFRNSSTVYTGQVTPTLLATLSGSQVTFSGTANIGQTIGIGVRTLGTSGYGYSYRIQANDTPTTVAATFASHLQGASASGAVLTVNAANKNIIVTVGGDVTQWQEVHRNKQTFMVTIWSPNVTTRDQISTFLDPALIYIDHLYLPDGSVSEPVIGYGTHIDDCVGKEYMWKRTLFYCITYPTSYTQVLPVMTLGEEIIGNTTLID